MNLVRNERTRLGTYAEVPLATRIEEKCVPEPNSGCWLWMAGLNHNGYGQIMREGKKVAAHRASYELYRGPIPPGLQLDHLCRTRSCVNPWHLEPVTQRENNHRSPFLNPTHCAQGHEYAGDNLYVYARKSDGAICRMCRACSRGRTRKYRASGKRRVR